MNPNEDQARGTLSLDGDVFGDSQGGGGPLPALLHILPAQFFQRSFQILNVANLALQLALHNVLSAQDPFFISVPLIHNQLRLIH